MATKIPQTKNEAFAQLDAMLSEKEKEGTFEEFSVVRREGNRDVNRTLQYYNLDAIISVGYRVNSIRATQFRQWATSVLREFAIRGYVLE